MLQGGRLTEAEFLVWAKKNATSAAILSAFTSVQNRRMRRLMAPPAAISGSPKPARAASKQKGGRRGRGGAEDGDSSSAQLRREKEAAFVTEGAKGVGVMCVSSWFSNGGHTRANTSAP